MNRLLNQESIVKAGKMVMSGLEKWRCQGREKWRCQDRKNGDAKAGKNGDVKTEKMEMSRSEKGGNGHGEFPNHL